MSAPVPSSTDICNGISALSQCSSLLQRLDMLCNFVFLWHNSIPSENETETDNYLNSLEIMLNDTYSHTCAMKKNLEPFTKYMR